MGKKSKIKSLTYLTLTKGNCKIIIDMDFIWYSLNMRRYYSARFYLHSWQKLLFKIIDA